MPVNICKNSIVSRNKLSSHVTFGMHCHNEHELYYMLEGKTTFFIGDEIYNIDKGMFVYIPKGIYHRTDNENCHNNERILVSFDDRAITGKALAVPDELKDTRVITVPESKLSVLEEILFKIENEFKSGKKHHEVLMDIYILELMTLLCRYKLDIAIEYNDANAIIQDVSGYIASNYSSDLSLSALSKKFSLSEGYLSRKFKMITGMGLNEYITYIRIMNAEKIFKSEKISVTDVAERCGFNDSNYFSTVFKKTLGITPLKFAKKYH